MNPKLKPYVPFVEFISLIVGPNCEVVLHDVSDLNHSVVALSSTNLTGRKLGDAITDLGLKIYHNDGYTDEPYLVNYSGKTKAPATNQSMFFRSSTFIIRDEGKIIGLLCINIDIGPYLAIRDHATALAMMDDLPDLSELEQNHSAENFTTDFDDLFDSNYSKVIAHLGSPLEFKKAERQQFVSELHKLGVFSLKGSIPRVASRLNISEQTVYRYLNELRHADAEDGECE